MGQSLGQSWLLIGFQKLKVSLSVRSSIADKALALRCVIDRRMVEINEFVDWVSTIATRIECEDMALIFTYSDV